MIDTIQNNYLNCTPLLAANAEMGTLEYLGLVGVVFHHCIDIESKTNSIAKNKSPAHDFFPVLKKNESLKHLAFHYRSRGSGAADRTGLFFENLPPNLQSLELVIRGYPLPSFFKSLEEWVSRSSLEKLELEVSCIIDYLQETVFNSITR